MKAIGIVRRVDSLGRLVLPMELRRTLGIKEEDPMEIFTTEDGILIRPYKPGCICCGSSEDLVEFNGVSLCGACIHEFSERS